MISFTRINERKGLTHCISIVFVTLIISILFYALNYYTPLFADDYTYCFSFSSGERIDRALQIIDSQISHYQYMNGRSITHSLAQLFLLAGDNAFNYINVFFFLCLLYLIYFHACGSFQDFSVSKFLMISMLVFLSCPAFGQSFLWITGAANYLYGILVALCVLLPYRLQASHTTSGFCLWNEVFMAIVYLFLGIIAGWTNENISIAINVMIIGYIVYYFSKSIRIHIWNITGCIGGIIGCFLLLSSPGTANRLSIAGGNGGIVIWLKRMFFSSCDMFIYLHLAILLFIVIVCLYVHQRHDRCKKNLFSNLTILLDECGISLIYLFGFLASVYSMIVSPQFPERAWSGPVILFITTLISLYSSVNVTSTRIMIGKNITLGFTLLLFASTYINAYYELKNINVEYCERVSIIETSISSGNASVEIPSILGQSGYSCFSPIGDLNADSSQWPNTAIAKYYNIDEILRCD